MGAFTMPSLGADMDRGTVVEWKVAPGDRVERGDIVAVVDTDKSTVEVEVFESGVVQELLVPAGEEVEVGTPLATIGSVSALDGSAPPAPPRPSPPPPASAPVRAPSTVASAAPSHGPAHPHVTSPLVRHLAEDLGVDTAHLRGSGPGGTVTRADVETAASDARRSAAVPAGPEGRRTMASPLARRRAAAAGVDLAVLRGTGPHGAVLARDVPDQAAPKLTGPAARRAAVAALMARSKREIPHYYLRTTVDLGLVRRWLDGVNANRTPAERIVPSAVLCWAVARAVAMNPGLNGHWVDGGFRPAPAVQLGVAVALRDGGLLAPVIADADRLDADEMMGRLRDLTDRARHGGLRASEMADPSITVTNLGDTGVEEVYGVIYPPQVAMIGIGKVVERPWVVGGQVEVRPVVTITLAGDHRATNGHEGARLLATVERLLQDPEEPWNAPAPPTSS